MSHLINHAIQSIDNATKHISKLDEKVLSLDGMSSPKVRHLLNNLASLDNCNYLEIGCWKGSTIISALYGNNVNSFWCIDSYNSCGGDENIKQTFTDTFNSVLGYAPNLINKDFTKINPALDYGIKDVNVYFYDGDHLDRATQLALSHVLDSLQNEFIYVVDDWNGWNVRRATKDIVKTLGLKTLFETELPASFNGDKELWWNGVYVAVLKK